MSKRKGDIRVAKIRKGRKTRGVNQPWGQGDAGSQALATWWYQGLDGVWDLFPKYIYYRILRGPR
jgi:hypothetical protein